MNAKQSFPQNRPTWSHIIFLAGNSVWRFLRLLVSGDLKRSRQRLNRTYSLGPGEVHEPYKVFRETDYLGNTDNFTTVLVVGFRLRMIRSHVFLHWLFQRICLLTTPFWSGFHGFGVKLWMVHPITKDYAGVYQWKDEQSAQLYVDALVKVLRPLSTPGSVWYELPKVQSFDTFLQAQEVVRQPDIPSGSV